MLSQTERRKIRKDRKPGMEPEEDEMAFAMTPSTSSVSVVSIILVMN
jgi:hypothetical protein